MKWIRKIFPVRKKDWNIYLMTVGNYQAIEITIPRSRWADLRLIYLMLLEFSFKECQIVVLSQFLDEEQGMFANKEQVLSELSELHGLQVAISKEYSSAIRPPDESMQYVLNVTGKPDTEWFEKVLVFGGASLSNIMYGVQDFDKDWLSVTAKRNQTFEKWYWLEIGDADLVEVKKEVNMLCWTSDSHINVLSEERKVKDFLSYIEEVASNYSLTVNVEEISRPLR